MPGEEDELLVANQTVTQVVIGPVTPIGPNPGETPSSAPPGGLYPPGTLPPPPVPPVPGDPFEHTIALVPIGEPLSVGAPPVAPDLVKRIGLPTGAGAQAARNRVRSGELVTYAEATRIRPRYRVEWTSITQSERDLLWPFMQDEVVVGGNGGLNAFDVNVDGLVFAGVGTVRVRPVKGIEEKFKGVRRKVGGGFEGVYQWAVDVEELF